jgi:hypothetical protein
VTAPSDLLAQHREGSRQLLEALGDLRPSLFRELAEGAVLLMVDAAEQLEQRADAASGLSALAGDAADALTELAGVVREASGSRSWLGPEELLARAEELTEQLRALTGNADERR